MSYNDAFDLLFIITKAGAICIGTLAIAIAQLAKDRKAQNELAAGALSYFVALACVLYVFFG